MQVVEGARTRGVSKIIGVDINPEKFLKGIYLFCIFLLDYIYLFESRRKDLTLCVLTNDLQGRRWE